MMSSVVIVFMTEALEGNDPEDGRAQIGCGLQKELCAMSLSELARKFGSQEDCIRYLERTRWHGQPKCGYCGNY